MREWWLQLAARERLIVGSGAAVLAVLMFFLLIWEPMYKKLAASQEDLRSTRELLTHLVQMRPALGALGGSNAPARNNRSLLSIVDTAAKQSGLAQSINRIQPDGDSAVRVWVEEAPLNELLRWIETLNQRHGVSLGALSMDRGDKPGTASARLSLVRS